MAEKKNYPGTNWLEAGSFPSQSHIIQRFYPVWNRLTVWVSDPPDRISFPYTSSRPFSDLVPIPFGRWGTRSVAAFHNVISGGFFSTGISY